MQIIRGSPLHFVTVLSVGYALHRAIAMTDFGSHLRILSAFSFTKHRHFLRKLRCSYPSPIGCSWPLERMESSER